MEPQMGVAAWRQLALSLAEEASWDEVMLAAPIIVPTRGAADDDNADVAWAVAAALRQSTACLMKGLTEAANGALACEGWTAELAANSSRLVVCGGGGASLAALRLLLQCAEAPRAPPGRELVLSRDLDVLEPLLARVIAEESAESRVRLLWLDADDDASYEANAVAQPGAHAAWPAPAGLEGAAAVLLEVGRAGPTSRQLQQLRAARRAAGEAWGGVAIAPVCVEVWALPVQAWGAEAAEAEAGGEAAEAEAGGEALGRLLLTQPVSIHGICMRPLHEAGLEDACLLPLDLAEWRHTPLGPPARLLRWAPAQRSGPSPVEATVTACASGVLDGVVLWTEVEVSAGAWVSAAPQGLPSSLLPAELKARSAGRLRVPSALREPQAASCVRPCRVRAGAQIRLTGAMAHAGLRVSVEAGAPLPASASASSSSSSSAASSASVPSPSTSPLPSPLPAWTPWMMNDLERAAAYDSALDNAMRSRAAAGHSSVVVVDIGAGAGLLSLLAARAAAASGLRALIYAVERVPALARLADATVEANRAALPATVSIRVINGESSRLRGEDEGEGGEVGEGGEGGGGGGEGENGGGDDGGGEGGERCSIRRADDGVIRRAHVIVSEVLGDDPLAESVVTTLRHAASSLLADDGVMIPRRLSICAAVASMPPSVDNASFIDGKIGAMGNGLPSHLEPRRVALRLAAMAPGECTLVTSAATLCTLDLASLPPRRAELHAPLATAEADAHVLLPEVAPTALVSWFELELGDRHGDRELEAGGNARRAVSLSSAPASRTHWRQVASPLAEGERRPLGAGVVRLRCRLDERQSSVELVPREDRN